MPYRGKAFRGAWRKGRTARLSGAAESDCPYRNIRGPQGPTWSLGFRRAWLEGFATCMQLDLFAGDGEVTP